jgi:Tfp pilus assembly protein PilF/4-amino-4-deoxy-L-arabinose transferase-like glycosyltransferase
MVPGSKAGRWRPIYTWVGLGLILAFVLGLGLVCLHQFSRSPFYVYPVLDEESYVLWAKDIVEGGPRSKEVFYQDPLYPYFLALVFKAVGTPEIGMPHRAWGVIRWLQVLMAAGAVAMIFLSARMAAGDRAGLLAAGLVAGCRLTYYYPLLLLKAAMVFGLASAGCLLGVACAARPEARWRWVGLGLMLGLLALLRGNVLVIAPVLFLWPAVVEPGAARRTRITRMALTVLGFAMAILPVTVRNYAVAGEFVLTTSQGGTNFYGGNHPGADGRGVSVDFVRANPRYEAEDFKAEAERRAGRTLDPAEVSRFWFREGLRWIADEPGTAARLLLTKALLMITNQEIADNYSFYLVRDELVPALHVPILGLGLLWGPALAAAGLLAWRRPRLQYPALFLVLYSLSIIAFFVITRYKMAVVPALAVLAAVGLGEMWGLVQARRLKALAAGLALAAPLMVASFWPLEDDDVSEAYNTMAAAYFLTGQPQRALPYFDQAMSINPDDQDIRKNLDIALNLLPQKPPLFLGLARDAEKQGRLRLAIILYRRGLALDPSAADAWIRLGAIFGGKDGFLDYPAALDCLARAAALLPADAEVPYLIGNIHYRMGQPDLAVQSWQQALQLDPNHAQARHNLEAVKARPK